MTRWTIAIFIGILVTLGCSNRSSGQIPESSFEEVDPTKIFKSRQDFLQSIFRWEAEEIPRNVTVYMDMKRDGFVDFVWAFPIQNRVPLMDCNPANFPVEPEGGLVFNTCETNVRDVDPQYFITNTKGWVCHSCPALHMRRGQSGLPEAYAIGRKVVVE